MSNESKIYIPINASIFQIIRNILLSDNLNSGLKDVNLIKNFLSIIDFSKYRDNLIDNINGEDYLIILKRLSESFAESSVKKQLVIQNMLNESKYGSMFKILFELKEEVSNEDIRSMVKFMSDHISFAFIFSNKNKLENICSKMNTGDYDSLEEFVKNYSDLISHLYRQVSEHRVIENTEGADFSLEETDLLNISDRSIKEINTPGYYLDTGFKNLDNSLGGGLKRGTLTLFGAKTSGFKSGIMLNLALSVKLHSKEIKTFDKTKKPCAIYLSLENTNIITFERLCKYALNKTPSEIKNADPKKTAQQIKETLDDYARSNKDFQVFIMYRPSNTIDIEDIKAMVSDKEANGYEVVALFVDYLATFGNKNKTFSSTEQSGYNLSENARTLYNFAINSKIAVVSGYQLNRSAYSNEQMSGINTLSYTGESLKMTHYADNIFTIDRGKLELEKNGNKIIKNYLKFNESKKRSTQLSDDPYFYELFEDNNSFRLLHSKYQLLKNGKQINFDLLSQAIKKYEEEEKEKKKLNIQNNYNSYNNFNAYKNQQFKKIVTNQSINKDSNYFSNFDFSISNEDDNEFNKNNIDNTIDNSNNNFNNENGRLEF